MLDRLPDLRPELVAIAKGVESVSCIFRSSHSGAVTTSVFFFDDAGKIRREIYHG